MSLVLIMHFVFLVSHLNFRVPVDLRWVAHVHIHHSFSFMKIMKTGYWHAP